MPLPWKKREKKRGLTGKKRALQALAGPAWPGRALRGAAGAGIAAAAVKSGLAVAPHAGNAGAQAAGVTSLLVASALYWAGVKGTERVQLKKALRAATGRPRLAAALAREWEQRGRPRAAQKIRALGALARPAKARKKAGKEEGAGKSA